MKTHLLIAVLSAAVGAMCAYMENQWSALVFGMLSGIHLERGINMWMRRTWQDIEKRAKVTLARAESTVHDLNVMVDRQYDIALAKLEAVDAEARH